MIFWFYLKKTIAGFLMPFSLVTLMLVVGVILLWMKRTHKLGQWLVSFGVLSLLIISFFPFSGWLLGPIEKSYPYYQFEEASISYVVVLGHYSKEDLYHPISSQLSNVSVHRLIEGISIYRQHSGSKLIFSGGKNDHDGSHPERMKKMAVALGVPVDEILLVEGTMDTYDEAVKIKSVVNNKPLILVTSASHMRRSMDLFAGQGMKAIAAPAYFRVYASSQFSFLNFFPSPLSIEQTQVAIYEYLGILWSDLSGKYED